MNDRSIIELIYSAKQNRIDLFLNEGQLQVKLPKDKTYDKNILEQLKANKEKLAAFFKNNERGTTSGNKINRFNRETISRIPLSYSQERLWFIDQLEGSVQYHISSVLRIKGDLNINALTFALETIVNRHEVLKTVFHEDEGQAYQQVLADGKFILNTAKDEAFNDAFLLKNRVHELINAPFDLSKDLMLRADLIPLDNLEYVIVLTMHHIASDGWSSSILVKEVMELYSSYIERRDAALLPLPIQYADYAVWQRNFFTGEVIDKKMQFWKDKLDGVLPLQLNTDHPRPVVKTNSGAFLDFSLDKDALISLQKLNQQQQVTMFMTLLAAFKILLFNYSNQHDICVGTAIANRSNKEVENLIGFFINTLALRSKVDENESFIELLQQIKSNTLEAFENAEIPFERVVDAVVKERDLSKNPLFQVMFVLQNTPPAPELKFANTTFLNEPFSNNTSKFDLTFNLSETASGITGFIQYADELFDAATIERMIAHYRILINSIVKDPFKKIADLQLLSEHEKQQLLVEFNNTSVNYPREKTIIDLINEQVTQTPYAVAAVFEEQQITYKELNERSNQLAHYLKSKGVKAEVLVPICIERSLEMIIGIVGILKAGGAYVPIDPEYPEDRIAYMLEDTSATVVLTSTASKQKLPQGFEVVEIDAAISLVKEQPTTNLTTDITPNNIAYVIYTSGSTGKPKGVMVEHQNVVRLYKTDAPLYDFNQQDIWTLFHSFSFDFSVWEIFGALFFGGKLVIVPIEVTKDVTLFADLLLKEKVTVLNQTPSGFYVLQDQLVDKATEIAIRFVIFGGEALNPAKLLPCKQRYKSCKLINMYGITETTVHVTFQEIGWQQIKNGTSIIGKPIPTLNCYILDEKQRIVPIGVAGELYVGGAGVARGYLNRPELTAERFIKDPFNTHKGARLYKTGDVGKWLADGSIEYLGRIDEQVKIRGYRIELGEIESVLQQSELVRQSVVVAKEDARGNKRLIGYVVANNNFTNEAITAYLHDKLPDYMVPAIWVQLQTLPLTSNGKIDKKALPEADITEQLSHQYVAPRTEFETTLSTIWQELLQVEKAGIHDNFFELGGDSIITIQVVSRAKRAGYSLKPKDLFIHQTISKLSAALAEGSSNETGDAEQGTLTGKCGLLPIQQWYFEKSNNSVSHFNQSVLLSIDKSITTFMLQEAFEQLTQQHDALRFTYSCNNKTWQQEYGTYKGEVFTEELQSVPANELIATITNRATFHQSQLNIEKGELIRIVLMKTPYDEPKNRLFIVIHHLAIDGVSWRILIEDLGLLLNDSNIDRKNSLAPKTSSYRQWYNALRQYSESNSLLSQKPYWQQIVRSYQPLPVEIVSENKIKSKDVFNYTIKLPTDQTLELLQEVPKVFHTEINDILLCALAKTICNWTNRAHLIIGLEGHGREHINDTIDTSRTVGWFTSIFPVLLSGDKGKSEAELIKTVKEQLRQIPDKGLGYGVLKYIKGDEVVVENEPFDIVFNYLGRVDNTIKESPIFEIAAESTGQGMSSEQVISEKLGINCYIKSNNLILNWSYSAKHYYEKTIKALADSYVEELKSTIAYCMHQGKSGAVYTPSDFGLGSSVTYQELDSFLEEDNSDNIMSF